MIIDINLNLEEIKALDAWASEKGIGRRKILQEAIRLYNLYELGCLFGSDQVNASLYDIIKATEAICEGPVEVKSSYDPEYPEHKWIVLTVSTYGNVVDLERQWVKQVATLSPRLDVRLVVRQHELVS